MAPAMISISLRIALVVILAPIVAATSPGDTFSDSLLNGITPYVLSSYTRFKVDTHYSGSWHFSVATLQSTT
jgi:hypothetical protein